MLGAGGGKKFNCELCDYSTNIKSSPKKHTANEHKSVPQPQIPILEPAACRRSFDGCLNDVKLYSDPLAALCPTCELTIKRSFEEFPPSSNMCICCQETVFLPETGFCANCNRLLLEDNHVDSGYGVWVCNSVTGEIVCIDYSRPELLQS